MNRLARAIEARLRAAGVPYVAVDEAKRALFGSTKLRAFDLVIYALGEPNWLLCCRPGKAHRDDLAEWEKIFGEGFVGVVAKERAAGGAAFETLAGQAVTPAWWVPAVAVVSPPMPPPMAPVEPVTSAATTQGTLFGGGDQ